MVVRKKKNNARRLKLLRSSVALIAVAVAAAICLALYAAAPTTSSLKLCDPALFSLWMARSWGVSESQREIALSYARGTWQFLLHLYRTVIPKEKPHASAEWIRNIFRKNLKVHVEPMGTDEGKDPASSLHFALLAEASGGVSQERRVGRSCRPEIEPSSCEHEDTEDTVGNEPLPPSSSSDVEIRPTGALQSISQSAQLSGRKESPIDAADDDEPFVGMILQVLPAEIDKIEQERSDIGADDKTNLVPGRVGGGKEVSATPRKCISHRSVGSAVECVAQYELVELIRTQLGLVDVHSLDYMYKPVVSLPQSVRDQLNVGEEVATLENAGQQPWLWDDQEAGQAWRRPWLFATKRRRDKKTEVKDGDEYERMGDRAFAGGSHGEVWRARRRCPPPFSSLEDENEPTQPEDDNKTGKPRICDPAQDLVMKRLKLEHGLDLLEAGLREVYFGELLANEVEAAPLFTKYVDHFLREGVTQSSGGSSESRPSVELWIVFENGGPSLRSYIYTSVASGDFLLYQHSPFWRRLRMGVAMNSTVKSASAVALSARKAGPSSPLLSPESQSRDKQNQKENSNWGDSRRNHGSASVKQESIAEGRALMKEILKQVLTSADYLHSRGIVHRDIKPSNIMCKAERDPNYDVNDMLQREISDVNCVLGDFSSAWDEFTSQNMYAQGPSAAEQTQEYAPPEVLFGPSWVPFHQERPQSYDSWSIGVVALEMLLGTPNVFTVDQRTTVVLTHKMKKKGASADDIKRALYLAALSQFCIYIPNDAGERNWPLREGDPLHGIAMAKTTCTMQDFHTALRARDPLGLGFDSSSDSLLQLIWGLLAWNPMERLTSSEALDHAYFKPQQRRPSYLSPGDHNAVESQTLDPRVDMGNLSTPEVDEFICPKCGKRFADHSSCQRHATSRRHAKFCTYDRLILPPCLNAHSMLPAHPTSGYCDIQGRRKTIEDFHTVHLSPNHQFYGVFDGHNGNLASKYAASLFYEQLVERLADIDDDVSNEADWKNEVEMEMIDAFHDLHKGIIRAVKLSPGGVMSESGTTATILYVTKNAVVVANVGDSRAVLSQGASFAGHVTPIQITVDHVASNRDEKKQIKERGGFVSSGGGIDRVNGTLAVSRSLGDAKLAPVLSRVPHVVAMSTEDIKEQCRKSGEVGEDELPELPCFIVLASDGLWDVMSNQEAVDMVVQVVRKFDPSHGISWEKGGAFQEAAQMLTQEAYVRGSTDNIGVCVVAIV